MRHTQSKLSFKSGDVSNNLKVSNTSTRCTSVSKRISSDLREQCAKKCRKSGISELGNRKTTTTATTTTSTTGPKVSADAEKTLRKYNPSVVKKTTLNLKRIKKPNEKYKQIGSRVNKNQKARKKIQKKVTKSFERNDEHEGPPTLCETFSRITSIVAETVINEKENQKLAESLLAKTKKESATIDKPRREANSSETGGGKSKGEPNSSDTSKVKRESQGCSESSQVKSKKESSKVSVDKRAKLVPSKAKDKIDKSKCPVKKGCAVKSATVKNLNEKQSAEPGTKAVKDDEVSVSGRVITTRRVSAPASPESEKETESKVGSEKHKLISLGGTNGPVRNLNATKTLEKGKNDKKPSSLTGKAAGKKKEKSKTKPESKEKKPKINDSQLPIKKLVDEMSLDKDKEEDALQGCSYKKVNKNSKPNRNAKNSLKANSEPVKDIKKDNKSEGTTKSTRSKLGSETDGSNSDELTLNLIQRKAKKCDKNDSNSPKIKSEPGSPQDDPKAKEDKVDSSEKNSNDKSPKNKKIKVEKDDDDVPLEKKMLEEMKKRRSKETESDTDEDLEFRKLLAKKLAKNMEAGSVPQMKRKRVEPGPSDSDQRARRLRLFGFWSGPKRHRVASLNALAKVHCLYENESKGVMAEIEKMGQITKSDTKREKKSSRRSARSVAKKDAEEAESEKLDTVVINKRRLRGTPGTRGAGKHWDMLSAEFTTSTSCASSDESHSDTDMSKGRRRLTLPPSYRQKMQKKEESDKDETSKAPKRRRKTEIGVTMDLKDMVVRKRMASLNASAILAASYSSEKRSNRKGSSGTSTEDGLSSPDEGRGDLLSADESDNSPSKKSGEKSTSNSEADKSKESQSNDKEDNKRRKNFWKTKVENLKKASKEKRNSPSPILADFSVRKDLSTTVLEKEKKDELNDDKGKDKGNGSCKMKYGRKRLDMKSKSKSDASNTGKEKELKKGSYKSGKEGSSSGSSSSSSSHSRKNSAKRKVKDELKNVNVDNANSSEKNDEYEYKSDSDNGQRKLIELRNTGGSNKKVAVIVNQDTDVTITGVYVNSTRSTHHEGFCSISGMQYRISSTSHTQTEATAVLKTSIASEQTPPPTEPTNCTSPRNHKSYTPLSALSNMQPPAGAPPHTHLPPPPHHHHHHHHCGMGQHRSTHDKYLGHGPPHDQYLSHGPPQGPISPLGRRHGCSSAFSAPHCSSQPHTGRTTSPSREEDGFGPPLPSHAGYFQPAGPLIHDQPTTSTTTTATKTHIASIESNPASESQVTSSSTEEIIETNRIGENPPPSNPAHHIGYPRGYPPYQGYYQGGYYPPPQASHYQTPPPPPPPPAFHHYHHHHQDLCYPPAYPTTTYPPPPATYRRFLQPAPGYFTSDVAYTSTAPSASQDTGNQQIVVPGGPSSSYSAPLDPYSPPAPYYAGYSGPSAACYSHSPSSRSLAFIEQTYQSCPCPVQSCPKNVHIGPLTGECKRPGALPLPPVALQLPQEPPGTAGPPSPARGSAGVAPLSSPLNNARSNYGQFMDGRQGRPVGDYRQARPGPSDLHQAISAPIDLRQARPGPIDLRQERLLPIDLRQVRPSTSDMQGVGASSSDSMLSKPSVGESSFNGKRAGGKSRSELRKKCKTEVMCSPRSRLWNPAEIMKPSTSKNLYNPPKSEFTYQNLESTSGGGRDSNFPNVFSHVQGLLAISSPGFPQIPLWNPNQKREDIYLEEIDENENEEQKLVPEGSGRESEQNTRKRKSFSDDQIKNRKKRKAEVEKMNIDNQERISEIVEKFEENAKSVEERSSKEKAEGSVLKVIENPVHLGAALGIKQDEVKENGEKVEGVEEKGQVKEDKKQNKEDKEPSKDDKEQRKEDKEQKREDKEQRKEDKEQAKKDKEKTKEGQGEMEDENGQKDKDETLEENEAAKEKETETQEQEQEQEKQEQEQRQDRGEGEETVEEEEMQGNVEENMESEDLLKRGKRKVEAQDEGSDKEKKSKKKSIVNQKDELEIAAGSTQTSHEILLNPKAKLPKERHDTVAEVIEDVIKGGTNPDTESEKISGRRKSSQEKSSAPDADSQDTERSRSCSPKRDESRSPRRAASDEARRRLSEYESMRVARIYSKCSRSQPRSKSADKGGHEHSRTSKSSKKGSKSGSKSKKSASTSALVPRRMTIDSVMMALSPNPASPPKWSNGWSWDSNPYPARVYLANDDTPVYRRCYSAMRHVEGDVIRLKDCVLLKSGPRKTDSPFIAKVTAMWDNPEDGEMMISLLWYYRPEHTDQVRDLCDGADEIFASRHMDTNSVACIEDKCFVLTYNEYCRYRKRVRQLEEGVPDRPPIVPPWETPYPRLRRQPPCAMAPGLVFYCRRVYDFRQKRLLKNPS